jgi:hypothetical protein
MVIALSGRGVDVILAVGNQFQLRQTRVEAVTRKALGEQAPFGVEDGQRLK